MSKPKKRPGSRSTSALGDWLLFDSRQLSWIAIAISVVLLFALMSAE
jgi:hypothetical protein